ncbi:MAG: flagellar basal body-associated FliL family protein [Pseudomonadota bacterium]
MAEEQLEPPEAPATGKSRIVMIVTIVLLVVGGAGAAWFFLWGQPEPEQDGQTAEPTSPENPMEYVDLSPSFVVSFPHRGRQRYMQAELSVMSRDAEALAAVREHMPMIRHNLISLFNAQMLLVFEDPSGVETLRELATEEVQTILRDEIGRPGIEQVLFTTFVMQ